MARQGQFARAVAEFAKGAMLKEAAVFVSTAAQVRASVRDGSALTGAPQMPVAPNDFPRAGALRDSITLTFPDANTALIYTTKPYAEDVEDNPKGHTFNVGGPHGWKLTRAAFPRIVETTVARQARAK
jgi:hypothetical protein